MQILDNLVSNAVKYSPAGGDVSLRIKSDPTSGKTRFSVTDTGPGLTPEDQQNLFREFAPLSTRPTHGEQSVGLGLWIVKRTTEAMDGEVRYETNPQGRGASFHVLLPTHAFAG